MYKHSALTGWMMAATLLTGGAAWAEAPGNFGSSDGVSLLGKASCAFVPPHTMHITPGLGTHSAGSMGVASRHAVTATPVVPVLERDVDAQEAKAALSEPAWDVDIEANLGPGARPGNLMVVVYDAEDPKAMARSEATAFHQVNIPETGCVKMRVELSPDEGARPNHTFRIQLVQVIRHHKLILADSLVALK